MSNMAPICASPSDLFDCYMANNKDLDYELFYEEFEGNKNDMLFFKKMVEHFVSYYFKDKSCLIVFDCYSLVKDFKSKSNSYWLMNEYCFDINHLIQKNKKCFKVLVVPFNDEKDIHPFANELLSYGNFEVNLWKQNFTYR